MCSREIQERMAMNFLIANYAAGGVTRCISIRRDTRSVSLTRQISSYNCFGHEKRSFSARLMVHLKPSPLLSSSLLPSIMPYHTKSGWQLGSMVGGAADPWMFNDPWAQAGKAAIKEG